MTVKRCEAMLEKIDGTWEQCDNVAKHGSDYCWECMQIGNKKFRRRPLIARQRKRRLYEQVF